MSEADDTLPQDSPWWARWLVAEWRNCWRWMSTWFTALAAAAPMLYESLPQLKETVPSTWFHWCESLLVILIFVGRMKKQS